MESATSGTDEMWDDLKEGIEQIFLGPISKSRYMILYTRAKDFIYKMAPLTRTAGHPATRYDHYNDVKAFVLSHVTSLYNAANLLTTEDILRFYSTQWERFKYSSNVLSHVIPFDNQDWWKQCLPEGPEKAYGMYQMSLVTWRDVLLSESGRKVRDGVLDLIEDERRGEPVDISLIRGVVSSYVELTLIEQSSEFPLYKTIFEGPFLENTERFYKRLHAELFEQNPLSEYVKKTEQRLAKEERLAEMYLHESTLKPLVRTLCEVLVEPHVELFYADFRNFLSEDKHDGLASMYKLMSRRTDATFNLPAMFGAHVLAEGLSAVERLGAMASNDPMLYVDALVQIYLKYKGIVLSVFANDPRFVFSFDKACSKFVNNNAVTLLFQSSRKTPEFFALYCDKLFRRSSKEPQEFQLDHCLDGVTAMLEYINDKDWLQRCSSEMLAKRLVQHLSVSDLEESLVHQLKTASGHEYVWTLQRMFRDMAASKKLNQQFMMHIKNSNKIPTSEFIIHVLDSRLWPLKQSCELKLPQELERIVQCFTAFYRELHSTRKLQWLPNVAKVEIVTNCFQKGYTLEASAFQMAVLLQYNHGLSFKVQELQESTGIDMRMLQQVLQSLLSCKLLNRRGQKTKQMIKLRPDMVLCLSEGYDNKEQRVTINNPLEDELEAQRYITQKMIEDERKIHVEAAIVRTMKVRKTLGEEELMAEIVCQLKPKFKATATFIKGCINNLIEKEYLEKDTNELNSYKYLA